MASSRSEHRNQQLLDAHKILHPEWREFVCGWGAAFINIAVTFPINKVMFRQVSPTNCHLLQNVALLLL